MNTLPTTAEIANRKARNQARGASRTFTDIWLSEGRARGHKEVNGGLDLPEFTRVNGVWHLMFDDGTKSWTVPA